ncbi:hypothetical protein Tco_1098992, partial [Tanacetum coccineum]
SLVAPSFAFRCSSTKAVNEVWRGSFLSSITSCSNVVTRLLNWKTDAKSYVVGISEKFKNLAAKSDEQEELETRTSAFCGTLESVT